MAAPDVQRVLSATAHLSTPFVVVDRKLLSDNVTELWRRSGGTPMRVHSSAIAVPALVDELLAHHSGLFNSVATSTVSAAVDAARAGADDVLVTEPSMDRAEVAAVVTDRVLSGRVTLTVDHPAHLALLRSVATVPPRVCIEVDVSPWWGRPGRLHDVEEVAGFARRARRMGCRVVGLSFDDGPAADLPLSPAPVRWVRSRAVGESAMRRRAVLDAVAAAVATASVSHSSATPAFVCGPGGPSFESSAADPSITEVLVGADVFGPAVAALRVDTVTRAGDRRGAVGERVATPARAADLAHPGATVVWSTSA